MLGVENIPVLVSKHPLRLFGRLLPLSQQLFLLTHPLYLLINMVQLLSHLSHAVLWDLYTHLFMLPGFETDDLQDAGAGDARNNVSYTLPHTKKCSAKDMVLP